LVNRLATPIPDKKTKAAAELKRLRRLLLASEQKRLDMLEHRLNDRRIRADEIGKILPAALHHSHRRNRDAIGDALVRPLETSLKKAVLREPQTLADALHPAIGPAIRKAIKERLLELFERFDRGLANNFSWQGLQWRIESWRTGRSFRKIVLLNTLRYRVEEMFLIHRQSGMLLLHVGRQEEQPDTNEIALMMAAIQNFLQDGLIHDDSSTDNTFDSQNTVEILGQKFGIELGPVAVLASIIRGRPTIELRHDLRLLLEHIHSEFALELDDFKRNTYAFEGAREILQQGLIEEPLTPVSANQLRPLSWPTRVVFVLLLAGICWWGISEYRDYRSYTGYIGALRQQPGIVLISSERDNPWHIQGLLDPLAEKPAVIAESQGLDPALIQEQWTPYHAVEAKFIEIRARRLLEPPSTVMLAVQGNTLILSGSAPSYWIVNAKQRAWALAGIEQINTDQLVASR
jgi:OOP family OmpA-OmpF porin